MSQRKYVIDLLKEIGMLGCKPVETLVDPSVKLDLHSRGASVEKGQYQCLVDKLIYLSHTKLYHICSKLHQSGYARTTRNSHGGSLSCSQISQMDFG